ncbi:hypothetical protein, partial [Rhodococcus sp. (in: high G+C Gram-positive bacteria)]|uniref:hypothetical protein n=1 Tax=Rhodococcus sp. TaxID=1831 RepID=UPI003BAFB3E3
MRLTKNADLFAQGVPNISFLMKGRRVLDPRQSPGDWGYSANAALCLNDYLTNTSFGLGCDYATEINEAQLMDAADSCDDVIQLAGSPSATEARYEINGMFRTDSNPQNIIGWMLAASSGKAVNVGGQWYIHAGVYEAPTITLDEDDFAGSVKVQSLLSRKDNANGVKGTFMDRANSWQANDFPPVHSDYYVQLDGERVWKDIDLTTTVTSPSQAQRLAKIELLRMRQGLSLEAVFKLTAYQAMTGKTVAITHEQFGWTAKVFEVAASKFVLDEAGAVGIELVLRETSADVFDWSTDEERAVDSAPNSDFPDPFSDLEVTGVTASSGTADLFRQGDGTIVPRIRLRWTAPANPFLDHYEIQFTRLSESPTVWVNTPNPTKLLTEAFVESVSDGASYDLRIRAVASLGNAGDWTYVYAHSVVGKTEVPSNVTGATAVQQAGTVVMGCDEVADSDLDLVEVRLQDEGETSWADGFPIGNILRSQTVTTAVIPPGTWELLFKARDTSGNYSTTAAQVSIIVTSDGNQVILQQQQAPDWLGVKTQMIRHWTGVLVPDSQSLASAVDWEVFDQFIYNAYTDGYYTAPEMDKGVDATARFYG